MWAIWPSAPWIPAPIGDNLRTNTFMRSAAKMPVTKRKATGAHFTPPDLARLVAERVAALVSSLKGPLRVLDPACSDGGP